MADSEEAGYFLTTLFPAKQLHIMDYNRVVKDLNGLSKEEFFDRINKNFTVEKEKEAYSPKEPHNFGMYFDGKWYKLTALDGTFSNDPIGILDITILQNNLLNLF